MRAETARFRPFFSVRLVAADQGPLQGVTSYFSAWGLSRCPETTIHQNHYSQMFFALYKAGRLPVLISKVVVTNLSSGTNLSVKNQIF